MTAMPSAKCSLVKNSCTSRLDSSWEQRHTCSAGQALGPWVGGQSARPAARAAAVRSVGSAACAPAALPGSLPYRPDLQGTPAPHLGKVVGKVVWHVEMLALHLSQELVEAVKEAAQHCGGRAARK